MQTKNIYETVFIINALLEDAAIESLIEKTKEFITANEGGIQAVEKWGRRRLAYPIKKKHNGFYVLIEFQSTGNLVAKLERYFQLEAEIIRSLVIRLDKKALKAKEVGQKLSIEEPIIAEPITKLEKEKP